MDQPIVSYIPIVSTAIVPPYCQLTPMENYMHIPVVSYAYLRYSPVTTSQTHALPRISTRGYTQKAAVRHA